jgi:cytochrome P450
VFGDDADEFKPERHLGDKGELLPGPKETNREGHVSFGFGRRVCVGKHLANESLFIQTARILWAASLKCARDENGKERLPDTSTLVDVVGLIRWVFFASISIWDLNDFLYVAVLRPTTA